MWSYEKEQSRLHKLLEILDEEEEQEIANDIHEGSNFEPDLPQNALPGRCVYCNAKKIAKHDFTAISVINTAYYWYLS